MNEIDRQAAEWAARSGNESMPAVEESALLHWIEQDSRHRGAYVRALAIIARTERVGATRFEPVAAQRNVVPLIRRRVLLTGSIAAGLAAAAFTGDLLWNILSGDTYVTAIGETRSVILSDGSNITLNTDTKTYVAYSQAKRSVELARGEALFDVVKNKVRPFVVTAGRIQVQAVGTSFTVKNLPGAPLEVLVREGVVRVDGAVQGGAILVRIAERVLIEPDGAVTRESLSPQEVTRRTAWQHGQIYFDNQPLAAIVREFARYNTTSLIVDDPNIAGVTVSGLYRANDPAGFARAASASLGLGVVMDKDGIHFRRKINRSSR